MTNNNNTIPTPGDVPTTPITYEAIPPSLRDRVRADWQRVIIEQRTLLTSYENQILNAMVQHIGDQCAVDSVPRPMGGDIKLLYFEYVKNRAKLDLLEEFR